MLSRLLTLAMLGVAAIIPGVNLIETSDDPPRRRKTAPPQIDILSEPALHEPEVLSKRAERRARGKAKGQRRG